MVRDIMQALGIEQKQFPINMIRSKISSAKNAMIGPEDMLKSADSPNDKKAAQVYLELERRLRAANAMDFDDLLVRALELLRTRPEVLDKYQERFRYITSPFIAGVAPTSPTSWTLRRTLKTARPSSWSRTIVPRVTS